MNINVINFTDEVIKKFEKANKDGLLHSLRLITETISKSDDGTEEISKSNNLTIKENKTSNESFTDITKTVNENDISYKKEYDNNGRLVRVKYKDSNDHIHDEQYSYDENSKKIYLSLEKIDTGDMIYETAYYDADHKEYEHSVYTNKNDELTLIKNIDCNDNTDFKPCIVIDSKLNEHNDPIFVQRNIGSLFESETSLKYEYDDNGNKLYCESIRKHNGENEPVKKEFFRVINGVSECVKIIKGDTIELEREFGRDKKLTYEKEYNDLYIRYTQQAYDRLIDNELTIRRDINNEVAYRKDSQTYTYISNNRIEQHIDEENIGFPMDSMYTDIITNTTVSGHNMITTELKTKTRKYSNTLAEVSKEITRKDNSGNNENTKIRYYYCEDESIDQITVITAKRNSDNEVIYNPYLLNIIFNAGKVKKDSAEYKELVEMFES